MLMAEGHTMRAKIVAAAMLTLIASPALGGEPIAPVRPGASATKARDIHGFALGMQIREALKRVAVNFSQGNQIQGKLGNVDLTFEACPSGAIYFIESTQPLGHFIVDKKFLDALSAKLVAKYGRGEGTPDNLEWDLVEPVRYTTGEVRPFKTNWAASLISDGASDGVSLNLKMLDFRICWAETERANQKPRDAASSAVKL
jgi:hypothetical protein